MIKANELRIGNWVTRGKPYIGGRFDIYWVEGLNGKSVRIHTNGQVSGLADYKNINPIPLTPEILEKAGFVKAIPEDEYGGYLSKEIKQVQPMTYKQIRIRNDAFGFYYDNTFITRLLFVHQLQNLYFTLTGEELNIQL